MDQITRDDLIRAGACFDGVYLWADKHAKGLTAMPAALALRRAAGDHKELIKRATGRDGDGYGYGDGCASIHGFGDGCGGNVNGYGGHGGDGDGFGDGGYRGDRE